MYILNYVKRIKKHYNIIGINEDGIKNIESLQTIFDKAKEYNNNIKNYIKIYNGEQDNLFEYIKYYTNTMNEVFNILMSFNANLTRERQEQEYTSEQLKKILVKEQRYIIVKEKLKKIAQDYINTISGLVTDQNLLDQKALNVTITRKLKNVFSKEIAAFVEHNKKTVDWADLKLNEQQNRAIINNVIGQNNNLKPYENKIKNHYFSKQQELVSMKFSELSQEERDQKIDDFVKNIKSVRPIGDSVCRLIKAKIDAIIESNPEDKLKEKIIAYLRSINLFKEDQIYELESILDFLSFPENKEKIIKVNDEYINYYKNNSYKKIATNIISAIEKLIERPLERHKKIILITDYYNNLEKYDRLSIERLIKVVIIPTISYLIRGKLLDNNIDDNNKDKLLYLYNMVQSCLSGENFQNLLEQYLVTNRMMNSQVTKNLYNDNKNTNAFDNKDEFLLYKKHLFNNIKNTKIGKQVIDLYEDLYSNGIITDQDLQIIKVHVLLDNIKNNSNLLTQEMDSQIKMIKNSKFFSVDEMKLISIGLCKIVKNDAAKQQDFMVGFI